MSIIVNGKEVTNLHYKQNSTARQMRRELNHSRRMPVSHNHAISASFDWKEQLQRVKNQLFPAA